MTELEEPASLVRRFGALLIDWLLCVGASLGLGYTAGNAGVVPVAILIGEYAFFIGLFAQTPGMFVTGLRCVSAENGGRIGVLRAALRGVLLALFIPALAAFFYPDRRGWHDRVTGSVVVPGRRA